jgi:hypothetical protein
MWKRGSESCYIPLQQSLANLARCPAWRSSGPRVLVDMEGMSNSSFRSPCSQLLAPIRSSAMKQVHHLRTQGSECVCNASNLAAFGQAVGSSLAHLQLHGCRLLSDFWPAVWIHLPVLQVLSVSNSPPNCVRPPDLVAFCRAATRPLLLRLDDSFYPVFTQLLQL